MQKLPLDRSDLLLLPHDKNGLICRIDLQVAVVVVFLLLRCILPGEPLQYDLHFRKENAQRVRFLDIVIPSDIEGNDLIIVGIARRDKQDRNVQGLPDILTQFEPVSVRKVDGYSRCSRK